MASIGHLTTAKALQYLTARTGLNASIGAIAAEQRVGLAEIGAKQIFAQNVAPEVAERDLETIYPSVHVYCEKLSNTLKETFRTFSGKAHMAMEVRVSQDRLPGLEQRLQLYSDALAHVLQKNRGDWGNGMFYTGGYEVAFAAVRRGGRNYLQAAKISFDVQVSV